MAGLISEKTNEIRQACEEMQVESSYLFGFGARKNDLKENSDIDF